MYFSIIVPVYNRPNEIQELLESLSVQDYETPFEVIIVEDGSTTDCKMIIDLFRSKLNINYFYKSNTGPGDSRNYGMQKAVGDYFIIFDSDCVIPKTYLSTIEKNLCLQFVDCYGGPDAADKSFSKIQKAINYSMTSFLTTGGIRGGNNIVSKFEPRSFNMGLSIIAFQKSGGFGIIHPGEDPDLSMRLWKLGLQTTLFSNAIVYHKRRIDWYKYNVQVSKFGKVRPILNSWHPEYIKISYFFPTVFLLGFLFSFVLCLFDIYIFAIVYFFYFIVVLIQSSIQNKSLHIGFLSVQAVAIQFLGYGFGFLNSFLRINIFRQKPEMAFPELFFNKKS